MITVFWGDGFIIAQTRIFFQMNQTRTLYKHSQLNPLKREVHRSLQLYCEANDPYQARTHRKLQHTSTHRDPSHLTTPKHGQPSHRPDLHNADHRKTGLVIKSGHPLVKQPLGMLHTTPIKVRRNPQNRDFTARFQKHQIIRFFGSANNKKQQLAQKQVAGQIDQKEVIADVFCDLVVQTPLKVTQQMEAVSSSEKGLCLEEQKSKIDGWSYKTIERVLQQTPDQSNNTNSNISLPASQDQGQSSTTQSQKQQHISMRSLLPMFSIEIIAPSSSSCEQKPTSIIFKEQKTSKDQMSIKCVSSSNELKDQLNISQKQMTTKSGCSINKTQKKEPSLRSIRRVSNQRLSVPQTQKQSESIPIKVDKMQQLSQNTSLMESVPYLKTLRSHFDSRNKINIDFTPEKQQKQVIFLKKTLIKCQNYDSSPTQNNRKSSKNMEISLKKQPQYNEKENQLSNLHFINQQLSINLTSW